MRADAVPSLPDLQPTAPPSPAAEPPAPEPDLPPPIRLGIAESDAATLTWLGYETPTEHHADQGTIDQSAMSISAPGPAAPPTQLQVPQPHVVQPPLPPAEAQSPSEQSQPAPPSESNPQPSPRQIAEGVRSATAALNDAGHRLIALAQEIAADVEAVIPPTPTTPAPAPQTTAAPATPAPQTPTSSAPTSPPTPPQPSGDGGIPGLPADKEAIAAAIKKSPTVRLGQVAAAKGLEIQTRHPRWPSLTLMLRYPRNPTVSITFGPDGTVTRAEFVRVGERVYNTGFTDVDEPLLNAIYGWTAKGKALSDPAEGANPGGGATILMTIILVG